MGRLRGLAGLLALAGLAALAWGVVQGDLQVALVLVVPVVYGSGPWGLLGIGLLGAAFVAFASDQVRSLPGAPPPGGPDGPARGRRPGETAGDPRDQDPGSSKGDPDEDGGWFRGGGVILLGPIPVVVGSDRRTTILLVLLASLLLALGLAWTFLGPG